jgi:hypothetical protein
VNLGISQDVANTLEIDNHHVTLSKLPREVTESLSNQTLIRVLTSGVRPSSVIIVLVVLTLNEILTIVVFEGSILIENLVNESVNELDHVARVD